MILRGLREKLGLPTASADEPVLAELVDDKVFEDLRSPKTQMALALGRVKTSGQVYAGTASPAKVAARRAKNKRAAQSRRVNRRPR